MMEHRWGERFPLDWHVRIRGGPRLIGGGRLRDISVSGAFLVTEATPAPLSPIEVEMRGPDGRHVLEAFVVRFADDGIGIEWSEVSPELVAILVERQASRWPVASAVSNAAAATASMTASTAQRS